MRGRVTAVLFVLLSTTAIPLFPQCSLTPIYSSRYRATLYDLSIDGNDLWTANGYGVQLFDRSVDPPAPVASASLPGLTRVVRANGNGAAFAGSGSSLVALRRNGNRIDVLRSLDLGGTINDLLTSGSYLFAATSAGLAHVAIFDPANPARTNVALQTSGTNVLSLAAANGTLYAADGDSTVELFSIANAALPQKSGTLAALPRTISVRTAGSRLYASDGQNTDVFISGTKGATVPVGSTSLTVLSGNQLFIAGSDRRFAAVDFTLADTPVELFEADLAPSGGSVNRINALQVAGGRLYVAAGDIGLLTYDVSSFAPLVRGYGSGATSTVAAAGTQAFTGGGSGVGELSVSPTGTVTFGRTFGSPATAVRDVTNGFLLTSSGNSLVYWTTASTNPVVVWQATLANTIVAAAVLGPKAYALLADGRLWSVNIADANPLPQRVEAAGTANLLARSANAIVLAEAKSDGTTSVRWYANGDFTRSPVAFSVPGAATSLAAGDAMAAVFTFRGISVLDVADGGVTVLPQSNGALARALAFSGTTLLELVDRGLLLWDARGGKLGRQLPLTAEGKALAALPGVAVIATDEGVTTVATEGSGSTPSLLSGANGNVYYRKAVATNERLFLFDASGVDILSITSGTAPRWVRGVRTPGLIDLAANAARLFTLASNGTVAAYSRDGDFIAQTTLNEGADAQPLSIWAAGDAAWVSLTKGCLSGGCTKKTLVLDPETLAVTASLTGGVVDLVTSGATAYALFDMPSELRAYGLADPKHPSLASSRAGEGTPLSLAFSNGMVAVLGDQLRTYSAASLTPAETLQPGGTADPAEKIRIDGSCSVVTGRTFDPLVLNAGSWTAAGSRSVPSPVKSVAVAPGRFILLTDHSIEIWSNGAAIKPPAKRHAVR